MAAGVEIKINGLEDLKRDIEALTLATKTRIAKGAMGTAASVFRQEAIRLAPEWTGDVSQGHPPPGTLKKAIYQARISTKCTPVQEYWVVGVRQGKAAQNTKRGKKVVNLDAFYARWVEYGHYVRQAGSQPRSKRRKNQQAGLVKFVPPRPFMRPAFETKQAAAAAAYNDYMIRETRVAVQSAKILGFK